MRKPLTAAKTLVLPGFLTLLIGKPAIAQDAGISTTPGDPPFSVVVDRDELAAGCPDFPWFKARIASHTGKAGQAGTFKITLTRQGESWHARIERREPSSSSPAAERVLQDRSPTCEPLAEAVAVTVAILADDYARAEPKATALPPNENPLPVVPVTPKAESSGTTHSGAKVWVGAGGGAAMSFISPVAPAFGLGAALDYANLRAGVRLMMVPQQKFDLDPGRVFVQAWLATVFGCLQLTRGHLGGALCVAGDASMLRGSAEGFEQAKPSTRIYEGIGLEAQPSWYLSDAVRLSAVLGALLPVTRESFSVTGRGVAYVPPWVNVRILLISEIGVF